MKTYRNGRYRGVYWTYAPMCDMLVTKLKIWRYWPKDETGQYTGDNFGTQSALFDWVNSRGGPIDVVEQ